MQPNCVCSTHLLTKRADSKRSWAYTHKKFITHACFRCITLDIRLQEPDVKRMWEISKVFAVLVVVAIGQDSNGRKGNAVD